LLFEQLLISHFGLGMYFPIFSSPISLIIQNAVAEIFSSILSLGEFPFFFYRDIAGLKNPENAHIVCGVSANEDAIFVVCMQRPVDKSTVE